MVSYFPRLLFLVFSALPRAIQQIGKYTPARLRSHSNSVCVQQIFGSENLMYVLTFLFKCQVSFRAWLDPPPEVFFFLRFYYCNWSSSRLSDDSSENKNGELISNRSLDCAPLMNPTACTYTHTFSLNA